METEEKDRPLQETLALAEIIKEMENINVDRAYKRIIRQRKKKQRQLLADKIMRYAACFSVPLLIASLLLGYLHWYPQEDIRQVEVCATAGSVIRYELPDHSVVWLNAGTKLRYPSAFQNDKRCVELDGEAYFAVQSNPKKPFYVKTPGGISIIVHGTHFNVSAYKDEMCEGTVLEEGKVSVLLPDKKTVALTPGEQLLYDKENCSWTLNKVNVSEFVAWKDGKLLFLNASWDRIISCLERHFNVKIQLNNWSGKNYRYRATFRNETLSQILDYLSMSVPMKWRMERGRQRADGTFTPEKVVIDLY